MPDSDPKEFKPKVMQPKPSFAESLSYFVTGVCVSKSAVAPLERIKLILQCQPELLRAGRIERPYEGFLDCAQRIHKYEGMAGFWRGNVAACCYQMSHTMTYVILRETLMPLFRPDAQHSTMRTFAQNVLAGGLTGSAALGIVYSLDYARTRLANDIQIKELAVEHQYRGMADVFKQTTQVEGLRGLYRGFGTACGSIILYRALYFGVFEATYSYIIDEGATPQSAFFFSYITAITVGLGVYPIDTLRRRLIMTSGMPLGQRSYRYTGPLDCWRTIKALEHRRVVWNGLGLHMLAGFCSTFLVAFFDKIRKEITKKD